MGTNEAVIVLGLLAAFSGWVTFRSLRTINRLDRFEFENRSDGGSVEFSSIQDATRHKSKRMGADFLMKLGCLFTVLLGSAFVFVLYFGIR